MKIRNCPECAKAIQIINEQTRQAFKCPHCGEDLIWYIINDKEYKTHMLVTNLTLGGAFLIIFLLLVMAHVF